MTEKPIVSTEAPKTYKVIASCTNCQCGDMITVECKFGTSVGLQACPNCGCHTLYARATK